MQERVECKKELDNQPERHQVQLLEDYQEGPCDVEVSTVKEITGEKA